MLKVIAASIGIITALITPSKDLPKPKDPPPPPPGGTVIVKVLPSQRDHTRDERRLFKERRTKGTIKDLSTDGDIWAYDDKSDKLDIQIMPLQIEEPAKDINIADERYAHLKAVLDARYEYMFSLKNELDTINSVSAQKWQEYHLLQQSYERQLKKIIADWVTEQMYTG